MLLIFEAPRPHSKMILRTAFRAWCADPRIPKLGLSAHAVTAKCADHPARLGSRPDPGHRLT